MVEAPKSIDELKSALDDYRAWLETGLPDLYPKALKAELDNTNWLMFIFVPFIHFPLWLLRSLSLKLHIWHGVRIFSTIRILTDRFSHEPVQCGLNDAYTYLGYAMLKSGDLTGAIQALKSSGFVWPCPHNTSFGLRYGLVKALEAYPEAQSEVNEYKNIARLFKA